MLQIYCRQSCGLLARWLVLLGSLILCPGFLAAHTTLVRTTPAAGAVVAQPPREVRFWFNEPIERQFSRIEVFRTVLDPGTGAVQPGERIDQGWLPGPRATREVGVRLPEALEPGHYIVQWLVLAIDTHRTQGSFMFTYQPSPAPQPSMHAFCKAVHGLALCLLLGGPLFWTCIWRGLDALEARQATLQVQHRVRLGTWLGAVGFLLSGAADVLRVAHQVIDPMDLEILLQFLIGTRYGNMMLLKSALIPLDITGMFLLSTSYRRLAQVCVAVCGLALLTTLSLTSHAAAKPA